MNRPNDLRVISDGIDRQATVSPCGLYRYNLSRTWDWDESLGRVLWIMLNPSTADASVDDPTIRRCMGFARSWGKAGVTVANLFALRSPYPTRLLDAADPIGPENDAHLRLLIDEHCRPQDYIVVAWGGSGSHKQLRARRDAVLRILPVSETMCLGETGRGDPRHPLYVRSNVGLYQYVFPASAWGQK